MDFYVQVFEPVRAKDVVAQILERSLKDALPDKPDAAFGSNDQPVLMNLLCPFSNQKLTTPVRSKHCQHLGCFDLNAYLIYNRSVLQWRCPLCNIKATIEDLRVDPYVDSIVKNLAVNSSQVLVYPDGMFTEVSNSSTSKRSSSEAEADNEETTSTSDDSSSSSSTGSNAAATSNHRKLLRKNNHSVAKLKIDTTSGSGSSAGLLAVAEAAFATAAVAANMGSGSVETPSTAQFKSSILTPTTLGKLDGEMEMHAKESSTDADRLKH